MISFYGLGITVAGQEVAATTNMRDKRNPAYWNQQAKDAHARNYPLYNEIATQANRISNIVRTTPEGPSKTSWLMDLVPIVTRIDMMYEQQQYVFMSNVFMKNYYEIKDELNRIANEISRITGVDPDVKFQPDRPVVSDMITGPGTGGRVMPPSPGPRPIVYRDEVGVKKDYTNLILVVGVLGLGAYFLLNKGNRR